MMLQRRGIKTKPIAWTSNEINQLKELIETGRYTIDLAKKMFPKRTVASIRSKVRKVRIGEDIFGSSYRNAKNLFTTHLGNTIHPKSVFEAYAGSGHQTFEWLKYATEVFACEINANKYRILKQNLISKDFIPCIKLFDQWESFYKENKRVHIYNGDAIKGSAYINVYEHKVQVLDLDTCGSTILTIPTFLCMIKPEYLVITHGEFHSLRFGRDDVLRRTLCHRDITLTALPIADLKFELDRAVKTACIRAHNEIKDSFYPELIEELWLGKKSQGMLRRVYKLSRPVASADSINSISN